MCKWSLDKVLKIAIRAKDSGIDVWKKTWGMNKDIPSKFEDRRIK